MTLLNLSQALKAKMRKTTLNAISSYGYCYKSLCLQPIKQSAIFTKFTSMIKSNLPTKQNSSSTYIQAYGFWEGRGETTKLLTC